MKRSFMLAAILFTSAFILGACGDDDKKDEPNKEVDETETGNEEDQEASDDSESGADEDDSATEEDEDSEESSSEKDGSFKIKTEDQLDLGIGDTGKFDTTLGTYELTLDKAELLGKELDGEETFADELILLDVTIKNTSEETLHIEDLMESMEITEDQDKSGYEDAAGAFDSLEKFEEELKPGEESSGQFISNVFNAEEFYFMKTPGNIAGGSSNQVIWTIKADEAK